MTASNVHEEDRTWVEYAWIKGRKGPNVERRQYTEQHQLKNKAQGGNKFRAVAMYGIMQTRSQILGHMVGMGQWIYTVLLELAQKILRGGSRWSATLPHRRVR